MINELNILSESELEQLKDALPLIAILIGGADNKLDAEELQLAQKITHIRTYNTPEYLQPFYQSVETRFKSTLDLCINELPREASIRNKIISDRLQSLNPVLFKVNPIIGAQLYKGFVRFAQEIAKASGGFLGFMSVNAEEAKWVKLPMLKPIISEEEE